MVNRVCDFCCNSYKINPNIGYYRVTRAMLTALGLDNQTVQKDFICGLHFTEDKFRADGKLEHGAIPTLFPVQEAASHDHNYHQVKADEATDYDGGIFKNISVDHKIYKI